MTACGKMATGGFVRERIGRVVIMGGAFDIPEDISTSAECMSLLYPLVFVH